MTSDSSRLLPGFAPFLVRQNNRGIYNQIPSFLNKIANSLFCEEQKMLLQEFKCQRVFKFELNPKLQNDPHHTVSNSD